MQINRARRLINFQVDRSGLVRTNVSLRNQLPSNLPAPIDGVTWYYNAAVTNLFSTSAPFYTDLLIWVTNGFMHRGQPQPNPLLGPVLNDIFVPNGITGYTGFGPFFMGKRVRFFSLSDEVIAVQEGGLLPVRFYFSSTFGIGFWRAGIEPPTVYNGGTGNGNLQLRTSGTGLTGTWGYKLTFADERFRESSPTPVDNITLTNQGTRATINNIGIYTPPTSYGGSNLVYAYLYRNTIAAPDVFYQIARHTIGLTTPEDFVANDFYANANAFDNAPDSAIISGIIAPGPGENDPPLPASIGVIHQSRVFLNDINDANTLQISNLGSTTQFNPIANIDRPDLGARFQIGTDQGNTITALVEFGSILAIFKRRGSYFLYGDNITDFVVRPVHERGCVAPDSAVRCDNVVCFLSDDGVYAAAYEGGDVVTKISKEIEADLLLLSQSVFQAAVGWHVDNRYHLAVGDVIYVYDFDALGWTCYQFGSGSISLHNGIPDTSVTAGVGFSPMGNSSLYGSIVPCGDGSAGGMIDCNVTVTPVVLSFEGTGGSANVSVAPANSAVTPYSSQVSWLSINGPVTGPGVAVIICEANTDCSMRTGTVMICSTVVTVMQARSGNCLCMMVSLTPSTFNIDHTAQQVTTAYVEVDATAITVTSLASWLHPEVPVPGVPFTGTIAIDVDANTTCADRSGMVQVCDKFVTVNQAADPGCNCNVIIPVNLLETFPGDSNVSYSFVVQNLTAAPYSCISDVSWITVLSCPGTGFAGSTNCIISYTNVPTDGVGHVTLCNAVFTILGNQHS